MKFSTYEIRSLDFDKKTSDIVLDRAVDTPGHVKDVVDGFNAVQKRYLATCLRMRSNPEKHKIDSKRMRVEAIHYIFSTTWCIYISIKKNLI